MIKEIFIQEKRPHESGVKHVSGYAHYTDDCLLYTSDAADE